MKVLAVVVVAAAFSAEPAKEAPVTGIVPRASALIVERASVPQSKQDPADSLYRAGRDAMRRGDYSRASELFERIVERYPSAANVSQAMYYQAFSLYRVSGTKELKTARDVLTRLRSKDEKFYKGEPSSLRSRICGALARQGDEACAAEVARTVKGVESSSSGQSPSSSQSSGSSARCARDDDEDDERTAALNALLQMDAERAMPVLAKVLERRDACSVVLRRRAVFLVSQKRTPETADLLLKIARNDPDQETREQAVFWLSQVSDERAVDMLQEILRNSREESLQNKALFALSQHRSGRGAPILREFAERRGASQELRGQAIFWLGQRKSTENAEFLKSLYSRLDSDELKDKVLFSLSQQRGLGNEKWLMGIVTNERESIELRKKALFWAGQGGVDVAELIPFYSRLTDREMKDQMIFVLSQKKSQAAVDKLFDIAKNDRDPDLRKKAIFWLGQSRDPRVQQFLLDLITAEPGHENDIR